MPTEVSIIVADVARIAAIRSEVQLSGRVMHYTSGNLGPAFESIRTCRPRVLAVDAAFSQSASGIAFLERVDALGTDTAVKLIVQQQGKWMATGRHDSVPSIQATEALIEVPATELESPSIVVAEATPGSTRRAPRFAVQGFVDVALESGEASVIDISVLGAQLVSRPQLRPNQKIALGLPDAGGVLDVVAQVAWCSFECPTTEVEPYYRAGIEFTGTAQEALEDYCQRHRVSQPLPSRSR